LARRAEDLDLVISRAELPVQLGELAGVLGVAALRRGREIGAEPPDGLGVFRRDLVSGGGGVAPDPVEFGLVLGAPRGQRGVAGGQLGAVVLDEAPALGPFLLEGGLAGAQGGGQRGDLVAELPGLGGGGVGEFFGAGEAFLEGGGPAVGAQLLALAVQRLRNGIPRVVIVP
jgi:hypothetical protein